ncbi:MAG: PIG-L deacetylase family protein [Acidimicrobiia bacterium]
MQIPDFALDDDIERVLVVVAHPDDIDFGTAGSVATWTDAGIEVSYCLVTSGDAGGDDRTLPRPEMAAQREAEQTAAAKHVGVSDLHFLGYPDGRVEYTLDLRCDLSRVIRQVRPQRVISMSPERNFERVYASHPDHIATGQATMAAVYPDARNPFAHTELLDEGLEPWTVPQLWIQLRGESNVFVDTTDVFDRKLAALLSHESQIPDGAWAETLLREWGTANAVTAGLPDGRLAELFYAVDAR